MNKASSGGCTIELIPSDDLSDVSDDLFGLKVSISFTFESDFVQSNKLGFWKVAELLVFEHGGKKVFGFELKWEVGLFGSSDELLVFFREGLGRFEELGELGLSDEEVFGGIGIDEQPDVGSGG
jgi:hypothetical protein